MEANPYEPPKGMEKERKAVPKAPRTWRGIIILWLAVVAIIVMILLESPSYYAEKGNPTGVHYGPITRLVRWIVGMD